MKELFTTHQLSENNRMQNEVYRLEDIIRELERKIKKLEAENYSLHRKIGERL